MPKRPKVSEWTCEPCAKTFKRYETFKSHNRLLHQPPSTPCHHCDKVFQSAALRASHFYNVSFPNRALARSRETGVTPETPPERNGREKWRLRGLLAILRFCEDTKEWAVPSAENFFGSLRVDRVACETLASSTTAVFFSATPTLSVLREQFPVADYAWESLQSGLRISRRVGSIPIKLAVNFLDATVPVQALSFGSEEGPITARIRFSFVSSSILQHGNIMLVVDPVLFPVLSAWKDVSFYNDFLRTP